MNAYRLLNGLAIIVLLVAGLPASGAKLVRAAMEPLNTPGAGATADGFLGDLSGGSRSAIQSQRLVPDQVPLGGAGRLTTQSDGAWRTYTNGNSVNDLAVEGDTVWAATSGGVVCWNRTDGSYVKHTTDDGLASNYIGAVAIDGPGHKSSTTWAGVSRFTSAPSPPALHTVSNSDGEGEYIVGWSDVSGADPYTFQEGDNDAFTSATNRYSGPDSECAIGGQPASPWYYAVKASNAGGDSEWSNTQSVDVVEMPTSLFHIVLHGLEKVSSGISSSYVITNQGSVEATTWHEFFDEDETLVADFSIAIPAETDRTYDLANLSDVPDGYTGYAVISADQPITGTVRDRTLPTSTATSPTFANASPIAVSWTSNDDYSGVASTTLWAKFGSDGAWTRTDQTQAGTSGTYDYSPTSGEGIYHFGTVAIDNADNAEDAPTGDGDSTTLYDVTEPSSHVEVPELQRGSTVNLAWTASDNLSGVSDTILWTKFGLQGTWAVTEMVQPGDQGSFVYTFTEGEGTYYFAAVSSDRAGNREEAPSGMGDGGCEHRLHRVYLPVAVRDHISYFEGPWEVEPNDTWEQANGPLISGRECHGYPDDMRDYFSIYTREAGQIAVSLTGHTGQGVQLQLFYQGIENRVGLRTEDPYQITHTGPAGWYYVYVYTEGGHNESSPYTLRVTYPQ